MAALRRLRLWSGLTYRQLEAEAAAVGTVLPSSTIATALSRPTLPRERLVDALTRACGLDDADVERWLAARKRIAMQEESEPLPDAPTLTVDPPGIPGGDEPGIWLTEPAPSPTPSEAGTPTPQPPPQARRPLTPLPRTRRPLTSVRLTLVGALVLAVLVVVAYATTSGDDRPATGPTPPAEFVPSDPHLPIGDAGSFAQVRPVRSPELCLSEGRDGRGYPHAVAALRSCDLATPPRTFLEPVGAELVFIEWHHPTEGTGCLTLLTDGLGKDLLEPQNDCSESRLQQLFRLERFGPGPVDHYRLRSAYSGRCIGLSGGTAAAGATAVQEDCTGASEQEFLIDLLAPA